MNQPIADRDARRKAREQEKMRSRKAHRATYDLPPALRERIRALAEEQGIPASQLVTLALLRFLRAWDDGDAPISRYKTPSRSPRYAWNLELPRELYSVLKRKPPASR
jgi:hypothetical protein